MGCCPSSSLDTSLPLPSTPSQPNTPHTQSPFPYASQLPPDNPPPYSPQPPAGHKSLSLSAAASHPETQIPVRGWGEQCHSTSITAWGAPENAHNTLPSIGYRDQQQLQNQVQLLQHFINIIQQESTTHAVPAGERSSVEDVESYITLQDPPSEQVDRLPALTGAARRMPHSINRANPLDTLMPIPNISFPHSASFPPALAPCTSTDLSPTPVPSNPLSRLPPLQLESPDRTEIPPDNQSPRSQRSGMRRRKKKRRRRRATITPTDTSLHSPLPTLQRPFTSPNLTATVASPLGSDNAFT